MSSLNRGDITVATYVANGVSFPVYLAMMTLVENDPMVVSPVVTRVSFASEIKNTC